MWKLSQCSLNTMTAVDTIVAIKTNSGFQVQGFNWSTCPNTAGVYTWLHTSWQIPHPHQSHSTSGPHLNHLADKLPPLPDCEVVLLIGYDCLSALAPREVIMGGKNEPFAQETIPSWSIIGRRWPLPTQLKCFFYKCCTSGRCRVVLF